MPVLSEHLGGIDAACCQLLLGVEISPLNKQTLFQTSGAQVATHLVKRIVGEAIYLPTLGEESKTRIAPRAFFATELERLFLFVLEHSNQIRFSFSGQPANEPWIQAFCQAAVRALRDARLHSVAEQIAKIAEGCLARADTQKLRAVEEQAAATRKRKADRRAVVARKYGAHVDFGGHAAPDARSWLARAAGFGGDDFGEDGELVPDSDCDEDDDCDWHRKKARYCELIEQMGEQMDLKGFGPWVPLHPQLWHPRLRGARLVVYYDEDGSDKHKNVPYAATVIEQGHDERNVPALWVCFENGECLHITNEDDWQWLA